MVQVARDVPLAEASIVQLTYGINVVCFAVAGATIAEIRWSLADVLNVPKNGPAFLSGRRLRDGYVAQPGDEIEFMQEWARKGGGDPDELRRLSGIEDQLRWLAERFIAIEQTVMAIAERLDDRRKMKEWYSPQEAAELLGKSDYTVREWCRLHRIEARKRPAGRGAAEEWEISAEEIERYKNHGLLRIPTKY
jgi:hypothetical protein